MLLAARIVAVAHLLLVAGVLAGGWAALARPTLLRWHLSLLAGVGAVGLVGAGCPLTELEKSLRAAAGAPVYDGGFIVHHLLEPAARAGLPRLDDGDALVLAVALNAGAYAVLAVRLLPLSQAVRPSTSRPHKHC